MNHLRNKLHILRLLLPKYLSMFPEYNNTCLHTHSTIININSFDYHTLTHKYFNLIIHIPILSDDSMIPFIYEFLVFCFLFFFLFHAGSRLGSEIIFNYHISLDFFNLEDCHSLCFSFMTLVFWKNAVTPSLVYSRNTMILCLSDVDLFSF